MQILGALSNFVYQISNLNTDDMIQAVFRDVAMKSNSPIPRVLGLLPDEVYKYQIELDNHSPVSIAVQCGNGISANIEGHAYMTKFAIGEIATINVTADKTMKLSSLRLLLTDEHHIDYLFVILFANPFDDSMVSWWRHPGITIEQLRQRTSINTIAFAWTTNVSTLGMAVDFTDRRSGMVTRRPVIEYVTKTESTPISIQKVSKPYFSRIVYEGTIRMANRYYSTDSTIVDVAGSLNMQFPEVRVNGFHLVYEIPIGIDVPLLDFDQSLAAERIDFNICASVQGLNLHWRKIEDAAQYTIELFKAWKLASYWEPTQSPSSRIPETREEFEWVCPPDLFPRYQTAHPPLAVQYEDIQSMFNQTVDRNTFFISVSGLLVGCYLVRVIAEDRSGTIIGKSQTEIVKLTPSIELQGTRQRRGNRG